MSAEFKKIFLMHILNLMVLLAANFIYYTNLESIILNYSILFQINSLYLLIYKY